MGDKNAIYKYFSGENYERVNFKTIASQVDQDANHRFVTDTEKQSWNNKASTAIASQSVAGLMSAADKMALDKMTSTIKSIVLNTFYPIGTIYYSTRNINPKEFMGGSWIEWGTGRVPVGVDTKDIDFNVADKIGGEKGHKLLESEIPSHSHEQYIRLSGRGKGGTADCVMDSYEDTDNSYYVNSGRESQGIVTGSTGGNGWHNNLQPYITCFMWKRTA